MTAPANDNFADATILSGALPITLTGETNVDATTEVDEPLKVNVGQVDPADEEAAIGASVWYAWTCGTTGTHRFLVESDFDGAMAVYASSGTTFADLERIDSSERGWSEPHFEVVYIDAVEDETYYFQVGGYFSNTGTFDITLDAFTRPANDDFADAIAITGSSVSGSTAGATVEVGEPRGLNESETYYLFTKTVWYSWTAPEDAYVKATFARSGRWATDGIGLLAAYTGSSLGALTQINFGLDEVSLLVTQGVTYHFQVGARVGTSTDEGDFLLTIEAIDDGDFFPFTKVLTLSGGSASATVSNSSASSQDGEPLTFAGFGFEGTVANTVWFEWEADVDGVATFDTFGSDFDTTAAAFTGSSLSGLTCIAFNDDYAGGTATIPQSRIAWAASEGTTYFVQVGSAGEETGTISAHLYFSPYPSGDPPPPPPPLTVEDPYRIELRTLNSAGFTVTTSSLELVSFSCNWRLNGPGAFEGAGVVGVTQADAANVGARELIVYKGDTAVWGGYLTFFDVDEDTKRVRVAAEGYWSRARARLMRGNQIYKPITNGGVAWKADVIAWDIIDQAQGASYGDMGWAYGGHSGTRKDCKRIYYGVDRTNVGEAIEALAREGYFDFSVDVHPTPSSGSVATFRTWYERGSDLSGSINLSASNAMTLNYSLASSDMATVIDVFGSVEGCRGVAATDESNLATYGRLEARPIDMETDEQAEVDETAARFIDQHGVPAKNAVATYLEGVGPDLTDYDLGDTIRVSPADGYVSNFDGRVVGRELAVEAGRAVITVEVER